MGDNIKRLGTIRIISKDDLLTGCLAILYEEAKELYTKCAAKIAEEKGRKQYTTAIDQALSETFPTNTGIWGEHERERWSQEWSEKVNKLKDFLRFSEEYELPLLAGAWYEGLFAYVYIGNSEKGVIIPYPERFLELIPDPDYSEMTPSQVRASLGVHRDPSGGELIPTDFEQSMTIESLNTQIGLQQGALNDMARLIDDAKHNRTKELAEIQAQMDTLKKQLDTKREALLAELREKQSQMEAQFERLKAELFLLDSQIYAIRCFAGEVVKFKKIRSGKNAPITEPIVVHQELRFLDEDLGRLAFLYSISWRDMPLFEEFLRHSPIALDTFAPNERCVLLVRLSRNGKIIADSDKFPYSNMLESYEYFHGKTVGIIIRNGENVYLGWTDEERVHIQDDLIIGKPIVDIQPAEAPEFESEWEKERREKEENEFRWNVLDGVVSRTFVYNILQGIVEHTDILPLPAGHSLKKQSAYVIYSVADKWLSDTRFGSFTDIVKRCNERVQKGDIILTVQRLVAERPRGMNFNSAWHNARGRGDRNRTHDVMAKDCTLYPVNLIEFDEPKHMVTVREADFFNHGKTRTFSISKYDYETRKDKEKLELIEEYDEIHRHVYISLKKDDSYWRAVETDARANFEIYNSEFINLTYMNSVWLEWVINTKTLGGWRIGGEDIDYAHAIKYLKTAIDHVKKREAEEKALIDSVDPRICADPEWPLKLTEWKLDKGVRTITEYQAKRFTRWIESSRETH